MRKEDCFCLGRIVKKYSFRGELIAKIKDDFLPALQSAESVFVAIGNVLVPFFMKTIKVHKEGTRLSLRHVNTEQDANLLLNKTLYLPLSFLPKSTGTQFYNHEIINFTVTDIKEGLIGKVVGVADSGLQRLFQVKNPKREKRILIPAVDAFIIKVDRTAKNILVQTPEGLLEL